MAFDRTREIMLSAYENATGYAVMAGNAIHDLFINVMADVSSPVDDRLTSIENALTLSANITHAEAIPFAGRLGIDSISLSGKASVNLLAVVSSNALPINISAGSVFTTIQGLRFVTLTSISFSVGMLTYNGKNWVTPQFRVEAELIGAAYNISAGAINKSLTEIVGLVYVTNPEPAYILGHDGSSPVEIINLIKESISNRSGATIKGASFLLNQQYPGIIKEILPIQKGDSEMIRDRVYDATRSNIAAYAPRDFRGKRVGDDAVIASILYKGSVDDLGADKPEITFSGVTPTHLDGIPIGEVSQANYQELYANDAGSGFTHEPGLIFEEDMGVLGNFQDRWFGGSNGSAVINNQVGAVSSFHDDTLVIGESESGVNAGDVGAAFVTALGLVRNTKIVLKGTFETTDDGLGSRPFYVTNFKRRSSSGGPINSAIDGFGMAIKVNKDSLGNAISGPNLFIVDGSSVDQDMEIMGDKILGGLGVESFIASVNTINQGAGDGLEIQADTVYSYELHYDGEIVVRDGESVTVVNLNIYIWEGVDESGRPTMPTLTSGTYTPINLRTEVWTSDGATYDFDGIGFGVLSTDTQLWKVGPIKVQKIDDTYPVLLAGFDVEGLMEGSTVFSLTGQGSGYNIDLQQAGLTVKLLKDPTGTPEWIGPYDYANLTGTLQNINVNFTLADYKSSDDKVWILISSKYPAFYDTSRALSAFLTVRYMSLVPERPYISSGEKIDLYVTLTPDANYSPETAGSVIIDAPRSRYILNADNGFVLPVLRIAGMEVVDAAGTNVGITLTQGLDYHIVSSDDGLYGSSKDRRVLYFMPQALLYGRIKIDFTYGANITGMQELLDLNDKTGISDLVVFHKRPRYIDVTMSVNYIPPTLQTALRKYIYEAINNVESFDMIAIASNLGVDYGSVSDILLQATTQLPSGEVQVETSGNLITKKRSEIFIPGNITLNTI